MKYSEKKLRPQRGIVKFEWKGEGVGAYSNKYGNPRWFIQQLEVRICF